MRVLAFLATLAALAAAALAGQELRQVLERPVPDTAAPPVTAAGADPDPARAAPAPPRDWPALFGEVVVAEPQPPKPPAPAPEPQPPRPPAPPIDSLGYSLQGLVSEGENRWAIVSHPTGETLLRVGDMLGEIYEITAIDAQGLWARAAPDADPVLLGFAE
ncbi:hypothetical protein [Aestuariicoccus sp. MJ-SS9]|uniref:hypothetical protein n=1 Tax=Aestuariicoccus sp. MJ-SS9 TaxID=3079855 RepID=UPI00290B4173|nr:hypothetical protein [Aestuariicoccus sp. MJ-SS9]MDU8912183.1 hypothetical protein [Aestuariicoccus sp. MJ-SS9]